MFVFALVLILIALNFVISIYSTIHLLSIPDYVSNSHLVIYELEATKSELKSGENSVNSYIFTGDDKYLVPVNNTINNIKSHLANIKQTTEDNPVLKKKSMELTSQVDDYINDLNEAVELRKDEDDFTAAENYISSFDVKVDIENINTQLSSFQDYEKKLYEARDAQVKEAKNRAIRTFLIAIVSMFIMLAIFYFQFIEREQKIRTEKAKHDIETRFQTIIEHSSDVIMLVEKDGKILYVGPSMTSHLGYSVDEAYGFSIFDLIHSNEKYKAVRLFKEMLDKPGDLFPFLYRIVHKDGSWSWMEGVAVNLINNLNLRAIVLNLRDVTERIRYEEVVNQSKKEIEDLYNHAPCGYYSLNKDFVLTRINDTMLNWLGYSRDEIINRKKIFDLIAPEEREYFKENKEYFIQQGFINNMEFDILRKDGSMMSVLLNSSIVKDENGSFVMTRSTLVDNTGRKLKT
jgi:PAS domain S-box-containing protein